LFKKLNYSKFSIEMYRILKDVDVLFDEQVTCSKGLEAQAAIIPHNVAFIKSLAEMGGVKLGAVSSNYRDVIDGHLGRAGIVELFDTITSGVDELSHDRQKPHPDIYLMTANKLGLEPARCVGIEDTAPGIEAVKAAGMYAVGYLNPDSGMHQDLHGAGADLRVNDLSMLDAQRLLAV
jgi:HAD superfamily hydrolase (TIGR01509 family)